MHDFQAIYSSSGLLSPATSLAQSQKILFSLPAPCSTGCLAYNHLLSSPQVPMCARPGAGCWILGKVYQAQHVGMESLSWQT